MGLFTFAIFYLCYKKFSTDSKSHTVDSIVSKIESTVTQRLDTYLARENLDSLPSQILLVAYKKEKSLELRYKSNEKWKRFKEYPLTAFSGKIGPKLREGDRQIPEGAYKIDYLNPNSSFYLSMKINYPNAFDLNKAKIDGRRFPGTNIFIHGKNKSIGCLAIGDPAIEELFFVVSKRRENEIPVWIFPSKNIDANWNQLAEVRPGWLNELYAELKNKLRSLN